VSEFPSSKYNAGTYNKDRVDVRDPGYTAMQFDVFSWWKNYKQQTYPHIAICALIVFSKPIYNGF
jgi:hAT family C-terminal dimerisation region